MGGGRRGTEGVRAAGGENGKEGRVCWGRAGERGYQSTAAPLLGSATTYGQVSLDKGIAGRELLLVGWLAALSD